VIADIKSDSLDYLKNTSYFVIGRNPVYSYYNKVYSRKTEVLFLPTIISPLLGESGTDIKYPTYLLTGW
jgi:hypothetical protein